MKLRLTDRVINNQTLASMQSAQAQLVKAQQQAASGLAINNPSDDPVGAQQVIQLKGILQDGEQYQRNIVNGTAWLGEADNAMSGMGDVVVRAREIAMMMSNGSASAENRKGAIAEVAQLKKQLIQFGNSQVGGKYIFGGVKNDSAPYDTASNTFKGTEDDVLMKIDRGTLQDNPGSFVAINYSGGKLLNGSGGGVDILSVFDSLTTALTNNNQTAIQGTLTTLDASQNQISVARSDIGSRMSRLETVSANFESQRISLEKNISGIQDADVLKVYSDLASQQTAYQAALTTTSKIHQLSLLNFLR